MSEVSLAVNGREYSGWKSVRVTRSMEAISGGFELAVSERWGAEGETWPIREEDECVLRLDDDVVIVGHVDRRSISLGASDHELVVTGRDKTAALVDSSAVLDRWELRNVTALDVASRVSEPFGIGVVMQPGASTPRPFAKFSIDPGETAYDVLERACRMAGLLPVYDPATGLVTLTRGGSARVATALVEGQNILAASADFDASGRYRRYLVAGQHQGTDQQSGAAAARVKAEATDEGVRRTERVLLVRPEGNVTTESARQRAAWEAQVRAARGDEVSVTVHGWRTIEKGPLWPLNATVAVQAPTLGVRGAMLIVEVGYVLDGSGGTTTRLLLRRPDAYASEPTVPAPAATGPTAWQELRAGA